ncbi:hypothetical protein ONZ51_g11487 [Trametes cubensis]|uniref:F-box domain-containing protein n=1 Tax=Trametes cubensis TaxID=1111947 RepID=A0AAD7THI6_9APHY|nr:hypothetical protein ONZ51_g11487 [Trametes cubensis]
MSLSSLPPELLLSVFRAYAPEVDRTWLASVTTLCKTLKPIVESVLYREVTIISGEGFRTFCHSVASDSSRSAAVRKLALVFHLNDTSPVDIIPRSTFLSLINLDWLKLDMDDPSYLASLVDAPFRLRSLLVMTWHYHSSFEDVIASQHSLKTLTIDFGQDIEHVQASRLDIPCNSLSPLKSDTPVPPHRIP